MTATPNEPNVPVIDEVAVASVHSLLGVYLADQLAGAVAEVDLANSLAATHADDPAVASDIQEVAWDVEQDRKSLLDVMSRLEVPYRQQGPGTVQWWRETLHGLRHHGPTVSPLAELNELDAMQQAVEAKAARWRLLSMLAAEDPQLIPEQLGELLVRAHAQSAALERLRCTIAVRILRHRVERARG